MWITPAPPLTAFVAASIWSGVGEVKTSPGHAASSIPCPTNPPCIGSWPEPPPETSATLPCTGASARTMKFGSYETRTRSACACSMPSNSSRTTFCGSLISFFIALLPSRNPPRSSYRLVNTAEPATAPRIPPMIGPTTGTQLYCQSDVPLPGIGSRAWAIRGLRSRAGLIA